VPVVKINAIEVDPERGPELEERFARRASEVDKMPGFLGFELLRPTGGETRYFVYTRWETEEDFQAWVQSAAFTKGHAQASADQGQKPVAHGSSLLAFDVVLRVEAAEPVTEQA
jgi:heme-degrading monooxygenase HmoA